LLSSSDTRYMGLWDAVHEFNAHAGA
jgi:hypothetical protein